MAGLSEKQDLRSKKTLRLRDLGTTHNKFKRKPKYNAKKTV
jgi:hypothetical protein